MKHIHDVEFEVNRVSPDGLGLSQESIDEFRLQCFSEALAAAVMNAVQKKILPRRLAFKGTIEVSDGEK